MAPTFTYGELNSDTGTNTANGLRNIANQAANAACSLYKNYADTATGLPDPTGFGAALNGLYSNLCGPRGSNPTTPPSIPYNGGQCTGKNYNVTINYTGPSGPGSVFYPSIPGPLGGIGTKSFPSGSAAYGVLAPNATAYNGILSVASASPPNPVNSLSAYKVTSVTPVVTSGTDNCGNPDQQYNSPPPPSNSLVVNNNTVNVGAGLVINAPITIIPVVNTANVSITPQIQVKVGPFNVTFDAGGVTVAPNFNITSNNTSPNPNLYPSPQPTPQAPVDINGNPCDLSPVLTQTDIIKTKVDNLQTTADDIKDCSCPVTTTASTVSLGSGISGYAALPSNCIKVSLTLTTQPANAKTQKGNGTEPDMYFCGYYYWGDGTGRSERIPINTAQSVFYPPPFATAFGWNLYTGYSASITATSLVGSKSGSQLAVVQMKQPPK